MPALPLVLIGRVEVYSLNTVRIPLRVLCRRRDRIGRMDHDANGDLRATQSGLCKPASDGGHEGENGLDVLISVGIAGALGRFLHETRLLVLATKPFSYSFPSLLHTRKSSTINTSKTTGTPASHRPLSMRPARIILKAIRPQGT